MTYRGRPGLSERPDIGPLVVVIVVMVMIVVVIMVMVVVVVMVMVMVVVVVVIMIMIPMHMFMNITSQIMSMPLHLLDHIDLRMPMRINLDRLLISFNTLRTADPPRGHACSDPCASCPSTCPPLRPQVQREQPAWPAARPPCPVISTLTIFKPPGISPENPT